MQRKVEPLPAISRYVGLLVLLLVTACATAPELPAVPTYAPEALTSLRFQAVLLAGDSSLPVFDNATGALQNRLSDRQVLPGDIKRLSASPAIIAMTNVHSATLDQIKTAISSMQPTPGQGCLVFATSHGGEARGLYLSRANEFLSPRDLDIALARGCGNAPTVVVISGCYTGSFTKAPMARANRVILTAAREDRTSFGCGAGREYTVYDKCFLDAFDTLGALDARVTWLETHILVSGCVAGRKSKLT